MLTEPRQVNARCSLARAWGLETPGAGGCPWRWCIGIGPCL